MKKLLLASTALVLSAGVVAAQGVETSGNARMGVVYDGNDFGFNSRVRVIFNLSGETDTGMAFGASIRADNAGGGNAGNVDVRGMTAGNVFISGAFGRLRMGDVDGAAEFVAGDLAGVGLTGLRFLNENTYLSNASALQRAAFRYDYSFDGFTFALSADEPRAANNVYSIAVGYSTDMFGVGIGYEDVDGGPSHVIGYASGTFEGITVKGTFGRLSNGGSSDQYGISVGGTIEGIGISAFARRDFASNTHYGIGGSYSLGGGASLVGGVVRDGGASQTIGDFGLAFTF